MNVDSYFKRRLDDQIEWYDNKSMSAQKCYKRLKLIEIIAAASIPVLSVLSQNFTSITWIVALVGSIITIIESWLAITKYHENWIEYRSICETLKHERFMFLTKTGVYNVDDPFGLLVERVESIISRENINWASMNKKKNGGN